MTYDRRKSDRNGSPPFSFRSFITQIFISSLLKKSSAFITRSSQNQQPNVLPLGMSNNFFPNIRGGYDLTTRRRWLAEIMAVSFVPQFAFAKGPGTTQTKALSEEYRQGTSALADTDANAVVPKEAYKKLESGVIYAELRAGSGQAVVGEGSKVNMQWVLRKSNGYFVDSSEKGSDGVPFIFTVGDPKGAIKGVDEAVRGMTAGGTRRIIIPPRLAYVEGVDDGKPGPLPNGFGPRQQIRRVQEVRKDVPGEYIYLEVQVTKVR